MTIAGAILYVERKIGELGHNVETLEEIAVKVDAELEAHGLPHLGISFVNHSQAVAVMPAATEGADPIEVHPATPGAVPVYRVIVPASLAPVEPVVEPTAPPAS